MISKSVANLEHGECCGCKACGDVCPKGAISYATDDEGFFYPNVSTHCVNCGLCSQICPATNAFQGCSDKDQQFFGCIDKEKDRRITGSSGGLFGLLALHLMSNGYEICGAAFDERLKLRHLIIDSSKDLDKLKKSKYLQSDCCGIYREISEHVSKGRKIMFVGTPCQCAALKRYLGQNGGSVLLVDFACHGVPSQDLFDKCLAYDGAKLGGKIVSYTFRHKPERYGSPQNYRLVFENRNTRKVIEGKYYEEPFYCGFQKYITLRPSCYQCKWARGERVSDITLADFWGIEKVTKKWDRTDYPSLVVLNSKRGQELLEMIKPEIDYFEISHIEAVKQNGSLSAPTKKTKDREDFFSDLRVLPFNEVVANHLSIKRAWIKDMYYALPFSIRKFFLKIINR